MPFWKLGKIEPVFEDGVVRLRGESKVVWDEVDFFAGCALLRRPAADASSHKVIVLLKY